MAIASETFIEQKLLGAYAIDEVPAPLQITFKDCDGAVIDLSGYSVGFSIVKIEGTTPPNVGQGGSTVTDAVNGITQYEWVANDFQEVGMYRGVMWANNGTLRYASIFFEWFVRDSLTTPGA